MVGCDLVHGCRGRYVGLLYALGILPALEWREDSDLIT